MDISRGEGTLLFHFLPAISMKVISLSKEFALVEQILFFKSRPHFERASVSKMEENRKSQKFPATEKTWTYTQKHTLAFITEKFII